MSSPDPRVSFIISRGVSNVSFASEGVWLFFSEIFSMMVVLVSVNLGALLLYLFIEITVFRNLFSYSLDCFNPCHKVVGQCW